MKRKQTYVSSFIVDGNWKSKQALRALLTTMVITIFISCADKKRESTNPESSEILINTEMAVEKTYNKTLEYSGTCYANKEANLGTAMPGKVEKYLYPEGSFVSKGSVIAELSSEALTQAMIELEAVKKDYERISRLNDKGSISDIEYDHIKAKYEAAIVKTDMLRKNTSVVAPFDGVIAEFLVEEGENYFLNINYEPGYSNTSGILRFMQLNPLKIEIQVNEKDIDKIKIGQQVKVSCEAADIIKAEGKITYIKPFLSTTSRTAAVEIEIANPSRRIFPGMYAKVYIDYGTDKGVYIPINAIYRQPGTPDDYVFVIKDNIAVRTQVTRIVTEGEFVCVSGISDGDMIATEGKNKLNDGSKVTTVKE